MENIACAGKNIAPGRPSERLDTSDLYTVIQGIGIPYITKSALLTLHKEAPGLYIRFMLARTVAFG